MRKIKEKKEIAPRLIKKIDKSLKEEIDELIKDGRY